MTFTVQRYERFLFLRFVISVVPLDSHLQACRTLQLYRSKSLWCKENFLSFRNHGQETMKVFRP